MRQYIVMTEENSYPDVFHYLWNLGYILTSIMQTSQSNDVPILVESFKACSELFDVLGAYNYGIYRKQSLKQILAIFIEEINTKHNPVYESIINYSKAFSNDLTQFLEDNNIE